MTVDETITPYEKEYVVKKISDFDRFMDDVSDLDRVVQWHRLESELHTRFHKGTLKGWIQTIFELQHFCKGMKPRTTPGWNYRKINITGT